MGYSVLAQEEYKSVDANAKGMGKCVSLFKKTVAEFDKAKPMMSLIPSNYQDNFNNKYAEICKGRDKAINENKTIYFEQEIPLDQIPKPDCQNFVKLE